MLIYAIDDERRALEELCKAIDQALPDAEIKKFSRAREALASLQTDRPQIVFSDIRMPGIDGLELAVAIKTASPDTAIFFVTSYSEYALRAFEVHADGYLLKPVQPERILDEVAHLQNRHVHDEAKLRVQCFGNFEVFWHNKPLVFQRRQSRELFAYLIDRKGAFCMAEEIIAVLWEDETNRKNAKHNLRNLIGDLKSVLTKIGQENVLIRERGRIAVDRSAVDCDYYRMLDGDMRAVNTFRGEYMAQYDWAEITTGELHFSQKR